MEQNDSEYKITYNSEIDINYDELLNNLVTVSTDYNYERYKSLSAQVEKTFMLEGNNEVHVCDSMKENSPRNYNKNINNNFSRENYPYFSKRNFYINQILTYIFNYESIFFSNINKSLEVSVDLICSFFERGNLEGKYINISYLNRLLDVLSKNLTEEYYLNRINSIINSFSNEEETIKNLISKLKIHNKNGNLIDKFNCIDESLNDTFQFNKMFNMPSIGEESELSIKNEIEELSIFKLEVNKKIETQEILEVFAKLIKESEIINKMRDLNLLTFNHLSNLNIKHLYILNKVINVIDRSQDANLIKLFCNMIFRSKTFSNYLMKSVEISGDNYLNFKDKDVYMHHYLSIGNFFSKNVVGVVNTKMESFKKIKNKLFTQIQQIITQILNDSKKEPNFEQMTFSFQESLFNTEVSSLMSMSPFSLGFSELLLNVTILNIDKEGFRILLEKINSKLMKISQIDKLVRTEENIYINFKTHMFPNLRLILTFNSAETCRINNLYNLMKFNEHFIILFIYLRFWAIQRNLLYTIDSAFRQEKVDRFIFDNSTLMNFTLFYLIHSGLIPTITEFPIDKENYYYRQIDFSVENRIDYIKPNSEPIKDAVYDHRFYLPRDFSNLHTFVRNRNIATDNRTLGKLFLNFFHFVKSIVEMQKTHLDMNLIVDLTTYTLKLQDCKGYGKVIVLDSLTVFNLHKEINYSLLNKVQIDLESKDACSGKGDILIQDQWGEQKLFILERESTRILHIALNADDSDFIKSFFKSKK